MRDQEMKQIFGCERCWPSEACAAWEARAHLTRAAELIDESHFHVMILTCPRCSQQFVSVFTEIIDWQHGDDAQCWTLLPITSAEATALVKKRDQLGEADLEALASGRRFQRHDYPKGAEATPKNTWSMGLFVGPHD